MLVSRSYKRNDPHMYPKFMVVGLNNANMSGVRVLFQNHDSESNQSARLRQPQMFLFPSKQLSNPE